MTALSDSPRARLHALRFALITVLALALIAVGVSLGRWQLDRAAQKESLQAQMAAQDVLPALDQAQFLALGQPVESLHRTVHLRGLWLGAQTVYLDNRQMHGRPGFYVLTPFALEGSEQTLMVQRGWIQRDFQERTRLQPIETPAGLVEIEARIEPPPPQLFELAKEPPVKAPEPPAASAEPAAVEPAVLGSSPIRQNLDLEAFRVDSGLPLRTDVSLQQRGAASEGLQRDWPLPALGIEKHYGYAFQWFGLTALITFLYVWFQIIAPFRRARQRRRL